MTVNPLVIAGAGVPGAADSYWSALKSLSTPGTDEKTLVPEVGWIQVIAVAAISFVIMTDDSPATFTTILAANTAGMIWSDGSNIFVNKSTGGAGNATYYVLQHKP
jgi:hypothetical protein